MKYGTGLFNEYVYNELPIGVTCQGDSLLSCIRNVLFSGSVDSVTVTVLLTGSSVIRPAEAFLGIQAGLTIDRSVMKLTVFGTALAFRTSEGEYLTLPSENVLYSDRGALEFIAAVMDVIGSTERYIFDGAGPANRNLQLFVDVDGSIVLRYGTGSGTVELRGHVVEALTGCWLAVAWSDTGVVLCIDGVAVAQSTTPPDIVFGDNIYIGSRADGTRQLDGYIDELRFSSKDRSIEDMSASYALRLPLEWDVDTTYLLHFDGDLSYPADRQGVWVSPVINAAESRDYASLTVSWDATLLANTTVACQVRTSDDGQGWSAWYDQINGEYAAAPSAPYVQVRFILQELGNAETPVLRSAVIIYEGAPAADEITSNLSVAGRYTFAQLRDYIIVCNGVDVPKKYDGVAVSDISTAPRAFLVCTYRNRLFMAKTTTERSRLYFSDLSEVDVWPVENFIDINPNDGDEITALLPTSATLLIAKQRKTYQLQGYSPDTFQVSVLGDGGTISPFGIVWTPKGVFRLDYDGVWQTNFVRSELLTRPIQKIWDKVNKHALSGAALYYYDNKLLVAVPNDTSSINNSVLVYDFVHGAWTMFEGWYPSCFVTFVERGKQAHLFGSSVTGNVYHIGGKTNDAGMQFNTVVETAHLSLMSQDAEEFLKRFKWVDLIFAGGKTASTVVVRFIVDGERSVGYELTVPAGVVNSTHRLYPPPYGRNIGINIDMPDTSAEGATLLSAKIVYYPRFVKSRRVV